MQYSDDADQQYFWESLVSGIVAGDAYSRQEFRSTYGPGIRFLLLRRLGEHEIDRITSQTVATILDEIAAGRMTTLAEVARLIRKVMPMARRDERRPSFSLRDRAPMPLGDKAATPLSPSTLSTTTKTLDQALSQFHPSEREALVSYYARGFSERDVEAEFGFDPIAFRHLREQMVRAFHGARAARKGPAAERMRYRTAGVA